jgi:hypothetical protein
MTAFKAPRDKANIYSALTPWQTRLLQITGRRRNSRLLKVDIFPVDFADMDGVGITGTSKVVHYTALSHVWGKASDQTEILCNGKLIAIPGALAEALLHLYKHSAEKYLWVDVLCINQNDRAEKAFQVRNMLRIFEKADKVIAWLRSPAPISSLHFMPYQGCFTTAHEARCKSGCELLRADLMSLALDELWSRTWVRQEVFAAKKLILLGTRNTATGLDLTTFVSTLRQVAHCRSEHLPSGRYSIAPPAIYDEVIPPNFHSMVADYQHAGTDDYSYEPPATKRRYTFHWLRHLRSGTSFRVTDERDRVYGIFGMVSSPSTRPYVEQRPDINPANLPINYAKTVSNVYQDLTKYLINTDRNLDCLLVFEDRRVRAVPDDLPSWVTDWRLDQPRSLLFIAPERAQDEHDLGVPLTQDLKDVGRLTLEGRILCEIQCLSSYDQVSFSATRPVKLPAQFCWSGSPESIFGTATDLDNRDESIESSYMECMIRLTNGQPITARAHVPKTTRIGDVLTFLRGARYPFVLRYQSEGTYSLVGPALFGPEIWSLLHYPVVTAIMPPGWSSEGVRTFTIA